MTTELKPSARKLLQTIATMPQPTLIHSGQPRTIWRLGSHDGFSARAQTYLALADAGYVDIAYGFSGRRDINITDAGRAYLAGP